MIEIYKKKIQIQNIKNIKNSLQESNLSYKIGEVLEHLQIFPTNIIMMICIFITVFITNICSNTVTASIFIPIFAGLAKSLEIHPMYLMIPVTIASSLAFTLPVRFNFG